MKQVPVTPGAQVGRRRRHVLRDEQGRPVEGFLSSRREIERWLEARLEVLAALDPRDVLRLQDEQTAQLWKAAA